jgi:tyrosine-protein kinase Etk/Wzc
MNRNTSLTSDTIDFAKLKAIFRKNIVWIILIFALCNLIAYLYIRYTKDVFEAESEIKLEVRTEANDFGITKLIEDQNVNLISGEIELIESTLFLSRVIDSLDLEISYYSVGDFLNYELYRNSPFTIVTKNVDPQHYNVIHVIEPISSTAYEITLKNGKKIQGDYGRKLLAEGFAIVVNRMPEVEFEKGNTYSFVLNSSDALKNYFAERLTVLPKNFNANSIRIAFTEFNADKAKDIVNKIVEIYLTYSNEQKNFANKHKIDWVNNELNHIEEKMGQFEDYFKDFTLKNKTQNLNEDLIATVKQINSVDTMRFLLSVKIKSLNTIQNGLEAGNNNVYLNLADREMLPREMTDEFTAFQKKLLELNDLKLSYKDKTFAYKQQQQEIDFVQNKLAQQTEELRTSWQNQLQSLNKRKQQLESTFANMPDKATEYTKNQRYYKLYEEFYFTLMQSRSEFEIAQAGSIPNFKILSRATTPSIPIFPNKVLISAAGFTTGLVFIFFFVGLLYLLNDKITSIHELERIAKIPILGIIPSFRSSRKEALPVQTQPRSMVSESIRTLRTNLDFFPITNLQKVIAVSSTVSGEGKSFVARNLGAVIAMSNKRVVLLDLDMRKPKNDQPPPFNNNANGISTILINRTTWQECVQKSEVDNFDVIPAGPHPPNPSELLVNGTFQKLVNDLRKEYDFIIMDTPPVGIVTDGIMAMKQADISIYIFRANYSKKEFLYNLDRVHTLHNITNLTAILNALPDTAESYGYGYYHEEKRKSKYFKSLFKSA